MLYVYRFLLFVGVVALAFASLLALQRAIG